MNGLFVTGTGTNIGKTVLSGLLLAELRNRGINAVPMKPTQTGCTTSLDSPTLSAPDLDYSLSMASMNPVDSSTYNRMSPYRYQPACSPHLAAEEAKEQIDIAEIVIAARELEKTYSFILAEGAGGILVPVNRCELMIDLMQALNFPVLIAASPGLGTINHTLLSIRTLRSDGLEIAGVVFVENTSSSGGIIEQDNHHTIEQFGKVPVLGTIPYCEQMQTPSPIYENLPHVVSEKVKRIVDQLKL